MPLSVADRYKAHVENLRALDVACTHIHRELKDCLAQRQTTPAKALLRTFVLLVGAWSEVRLLKMLHESNAFSDVERAQILAKGTKLDQWKLAVELSFRRRYNAPPDALPRMASHQFNDIISLIDNDLRPIIEIRNRLAHGQWARVLTSDLTEISPPMMALLNTENALSANFKKRIIEEVSRIINDLIVGNAAFERDFNAHYKQLDQTRRDLRNRDYTEWADHLRSKFERGRLRRNQGASIDPAPPHSAV
ncbi:hypothetical protein ACNJX9_08795 [Bradyrhizobium sp. DASA03076]|uniref:hypothetical protein n=1 Tax=Bradyrhizobium sp. BLXBL-03 TaxID=3395916 RepID=UPI003F6EB1BD